MEFWQGLIPHLEFLGEVHYSTVLMSWAVMGLILLLAFLSTRNLQVVPSKGQVVTEGFFDFCRSVTMSTAGKKGDGYLFFIGSLFLFIMISNLSGQLPLRLIQLPHGAELKPATADFAATTALAILAVIMYFAVGIKRKGIHYFEHYFHPFWWMFPLNLLEDITRPSSLSMRLYFNILVGEILAMLCLKILPIGLPIVIILFELLVAVIQAYVFALLAAVYISLVSAEHHDHDVPTIL